MRTLYVGDATLVKERELRALEYSVVACDMLNEELKMVGESYGIRVRMTEPMAEGELLKWSDSETVCDITTKQEEILKFADRLRRLRVTPMSLRDVVYDSLPL